MNNGLTTTEYLQNREQEALMKIYDLENQLKEAEAVIGFYAHQPNWSGPLGHEKSNMILDDYDYISDPRAWDKCDVGGKRARAYFQKHPRQGKEQ